MSGKVLNTTLSNTGYLRFSFAGSRIEGCDSRVVSVFVHKLQAFQKFGDRLFQADVLVRHKNGDETDNSWKNIIIGTQQDNMFDREAEVRRAHAVRAASHLRKYSEKKVAKIRKAREDGLTYSQLTAKFGVSKSMLSYMLSPNAKFKSSY